MLSWSRGLSDLSSSVPFADFVADYVFGLTTTGPSQSRAQGAPGKEGAEGRSLPPRVASEDYWAGSPGSPCPAMTVRTVVRARGVGVRSRSVMPQPYGAVCLGGAYSGTAATARQLALSCFLTRSLRPFFLRRRTRSTATRRASTLRRRESA